MAAKQIAYDIDARERMLRGIQKLAKAVKTTLGPSGRVVVLEKSFGAPNVTKDGVTVADFGAKAKLLGFGEAKLPLGFFLFGETFVGEPAIALAVVAALAAAGGTALPRNRIRDCCRSVSTRPSMSSEVFGFSVSASFTFFL